MDLVLQPSWEETLIDPLNLFVPILDSIFIQITKMIRRTLDKVKAIEEVRSLTQHVCATGKLMKSGCAEHSKTEDEA